MNSHRALSEAAAAELQPLDLAIARACDEVSHNLNGQRLGRKGRETRERIVRAAIEELEAGTDEPFTLSAVARRASLGMTSLYNYFTDLSELMEAVLDPLMSLARDCYLAMLSEYWPDRHLAERCNQFWELYTTFWNGHAGILHQRNRMSDAGDERMLKCRVNAGLPLMEGIARQLVAQEGQTPLAEHEAMGSVLATMIERTVTVQSKPGYYAMTSLFSTNAQPGFSSAGPRLLELGIRDGRTAKPIIQQVPRSI